MSGGSWGTPVDISSTPPVTLASMSTEGIGGANEEAIGEYTDMLDSGDEIISVEINGVAMICEDGSNVAVSSDPSSLIVDDGS